MRKLITTLTALFFLGAIGVPLWAQSMGSEGTAHGLKTGLVKPNPKAKKHKKKAHPVNRGAEESLEKGANGPENASVKSAGHAGAATLKGGAPSGDKAGRTTIRK